MSTTDKEQQKRPKLQNFIPGWLPHVAIERLMIAQLQEQGLSTDEIVLLLRERDKRMMEPVLVDIGDDEDEQV